MAVAVPKRRSDSQAAAAPSRTAPPEPKKRPRDRPKASGQGRAATATPTAPSKGKKRPRKVRLDDPPRKPASKAASSVRAAAAKAAPARKPARRKVAPKRRPASVIPIAAGHAGRAAVAVTQLPESGLIHRLTRGRAWIGVLGVLLVGIVALNVVTLSFAASSGKIEAKNTELAKENSMLQNLEAKKYGQAPLRNAAAHLGLKNQPDMVPQLVNAKASDVAEAASRLAAAAVGVAASDEGEAGAEGAADGRETASGEESATAEGAAAAGEESAEGPSAESEFTPEETAIYEREWAEVQAAEGVTEVSAE